MTTRTIEVQETVEKDVKVCDECGLGEEAGEMHDVTHLPGEDMHFHGECVDDSRESGISIREEYNGTLNNYETDFHPIIFNATIFTAFIFSYTGAILSFIVLPSVLPAYILTSLLVLFSLVMLREAYSVGEGTAERILEKSNRKS